MVVKRNGEKIKFNLKPSKETSVYNYGEDEVKITTKINDGDETEMIAEYTNEEYAKEMGADFYGEDAMAAVRYAESIL